jgi:hypothetical protein
MSITCSAHSLYSSLAFSGPLLCCAYDTNMWVFKKLCLSIQEPHERQKGNSKKGGTGDHGAAACRASRFILDFPHRTVHRADAS